MKKKISNQKDIINKPYIKSKNNNSKTMKTNTFTSTTIKQTFLISYISCSLLKQDESHFENLTLYIIVLNELLFLFMKNKETQNLFSFIVSTLKLSR